MDCHRGYQKMLFQYYDTERLLSVYEPGITKSYFHCSLRISLQYLKVIHFHLYGVCFICSETIINSENKIK